MSVLVEKVRLVSVADIFTAFNAICGFLAIIALYIYSPDITIGTGFIFLGMVFDGADGYMARKFGTKHDFGRVLDSIADAITFGMAPAVMVFVHYYIGYTGPYLMAIRSSVIIAAILIVMFAWIRLYKFTVECYRYKEFYGLATPAMTFFVITVAHILTPNIMWHVIVAMPLIYMASVLMVFSKIKYPKIRGTVAIVFASFVVISLIIMFILKYIYTASTVVDITYRFFTYMALGIITAYIFISPIYATIGMKSNSP